MCFESHARVALTLGIIKRIKNTILTKLLKAIPLHLEFQRFKTRDRSIEQEISKSITENSVEDTDIENTT
jgi:hypothetical protein